MNIQHGDTLYTVTLEAQADGSYRATLGEQTLTVRITERPDGGLLLDWGTGRTVVYTASEGDTRYAHVDGQALTFTVPRSTRRKRASGGGDLTAQMPGQVVEVLVNEGDTVESGQTLVILEAMKMEIRVTAPADGTVKQVMVKDGEIVERGQHLVEIG